MLFFLLTLMAVAQAVHLRYNVANNPLNTAANSPGFGDPSPHVVITKRAYDEVHRWDPDWQELGKNTEDNIVFQKQMRIFLELGVEMVDMEESKLKKAVDLLETTYDMNDTFKKGKCRTDVVNVLKKSFNKKFPDLKGVDAVSEVRIKNNIESRGIVDRLIKDCSMEMAEKNPQTELLEGKSTWSSGSDLSTIVNVFTGDTDTTDFADHIAKTFKECSDWPINTPVQPWHNSASPLNDAQHTYNVINYEGKLVSTVPAARETNQDVRNRIVVWMLTWAIKAQYALSKAHTAAAIASKEGYKDDTWASCHHPWLAMYYFYAGHILHTIQDAYPRGHAERDFAEKACFGTADKKPVCAAPTTYGPDGATPQVVGAKESCISLAGPEDRTFLEQMQKMEIHQLYSMDQQSPWSHGVYDSICTKGEEYPPAPPGAPPVFCTDPTATCASVASTWVLKILKNGEGPDPKIDSVSGPVDTKTLTKGQEAELRDARIHNLARKLDVLRRFLCKYVYPLKEGKGLVPAGGSPSEMTGNGFDIFPGRNTIGPIAADKKHNFVFAEITETHEMYEDCMKLKTKTEQTASKGCLFFGSQTQVKALKLEDIGTIFTDKTQTSMASNDKKSLCPQGDLTIYTPGSANEAAYKEAAYKQLKAVVEKHYDFIFAEVGDGENLKDDSHLYQLLRETFEVNILWHFSAAK